MARSIDSLGLIAGMRDHRARARVSGADRVSGAYCGIECPFILPLDYSRETEGMSLKDPPIGGVIDSLGELGYGPPRLGIITHVPAGPSSARAEDLVLLDTGGGSREKFFDPWWKCASAPDDLYVGPAYLVTTPQNGRARVAAMRAKIDEAWPPGNPTPPLSDGLTALRKSSDLTFQKIAQDLGDKYSTAEGRVDLAKQLGVPVSKIEDTAKSVDDAFKTYGYDLEANLRPLFDALIKQIGTPILDGIRSAIDSITGSAGSAAAGFSEAMSFVPLIGQFIGMAIKLYEADQLKAEETAIRDCAAAANRVKRQLEVFQVNRFPVPWHTEFFGSTDEMKCTADAGHDREAQKHLLGYSNLLEHWYWGFKRLSAFGYQSAIVRWWMLATTFMTDDRVLRVFHVLGTDPWGGMMASDEQVMLVAAPFAVANGLDVDEFAEKLWERSGGWSTIDQPGYLWSASLAHLNSDSGATETSCGPVVKNAMWAQLAVIAKDAIKIVEESKKGLAIGVAPGLAPLTLSTPPQTPQEAGAIRASKALPVQAVIGAVATGALYVMSAPFWLTLAPFAIVLGAQYRMRHPSEAAPPPPPMPQLPSAEILATYTKAPIASWKGRNLELAPGMGGMGGKF